MGAVHLRSGIGILAMQSVDERNTAINREFAQLTRLLEHIQTQLKLIRNELGAPQVVALIREIRSRIGDAVPEDVSEVRKQIEGALRAVQISMGELERSRHERGEDLEIDGISNLPTRLARFLAERKGAPGFSYEIHNDPVRGWVIYWKERTSGGSIRGSGRFYERPYAWIDE